MNEVAGDLQLQGIPHLNYNKGVPAKEQRHKSTTEAVVTKLFMNVLILDKTPQLLVYHPVKLGYERNVIAILPVLGEERKPFVPALLLPVTGIKHQLTLVNDQQNRAFPDTLSLEEGPGIVNQILRVQLIVRNVGISRFFETGKVTGEVANYWAAKPRAVDHIFGIVQALPRAWRAGV